MTLEKDLNQTKFRNEHQKATVRGLKLLEKIDAYNRKADDIMMNLSPTEVKKLNQLLDKIRDPDRFE